MGDPGRTVVDADEDVHAVVILPDPANLHAQQVGGITQGSDHLSADDGVQRLRPVLLGGLVLLGVLCLWHRSPPRSCSGVDEDALYTLRRPFPRRSYHGADGSFFSLLPCFIMASAIR